MVLSLFRYYRFVFDFGLTRAKVPGGEKVIRPDSDRPVADCLTKSRQLVENEKGNCNLGESLCIIEPTSSVVLKLFCGVAVRGWTRLTIALSPCRKPFVASSSLTIVVEATGAVAEDASKPSPS
jgi:hypothetical protein